MQESRQRYGKEITKADIQNIMEQFEIPQDDDKNEDPDYAWLLITFQCFIIGLSILKCVHRLFQLWNDGLNSIKQTL